jgi:hypothetical protein
MEAREAKATADHRTKRADRIAKRITWVKKAEARGETVLGKIQAKCGTATPAS